MDAKPVSSTATILPNRHCTECGWVVVSACCNDNFMCGVRSDQSWDWWYYCANKGCKNHTGEGVFQDTPDWVGQDSSTPTLFDSLPRNLLRDNINYDITTMRMRILSEIRLCDYIPVDDDADDLKYLMSGNLIVDRGAETLPRYAITEWGLTLLTWARNPNH